MPNPWTGKENPYARSAVLDRPYTTLKAGKPIIAAGAHTGIIAKFFAKGVIDLIVIYNSGRFRMVGHGSAAGLMAYGDANAVAMEIGEFEVLPVVEEVPVIDFARRMNLFRTAYVGTPEEAMAKASGPFKISTPMRRFFVRLNQDCGPASYANRSIITSTLRPSPAPARRPYSPGCPTQPRSRKPEPRARGSAPSRPEDYSIAQVKHYGVFQFKSDVPPDGIDTCCREMAGMVGKIPGLLDIHHGPYAMSDGMNDGFIHGLMMTSASPEARDAYLPHPEHERVNAIVFPCRARVIVFDFTMPTS